MKELLSSMEQCEETQQAGCKANIEAEEAKRKENL